MPKTRTRAMLPWRRMADSGQPYTVHLGPSEDIAEVKAKIQRAGRNWISRRDEPTLSIDIQTFESSLAVRLVERVS